MAKLYASLASSSVDPTQYSIGQGYLYTRQVYNFINNSLGNTLFYKSRVFKDANLIRNPLKRRYEEYDSAKSMDGSPYIGERYNIYEKLGRQIVFLDDVSGLTGYTYNEGYSDMPNSQMVTNMVNAIDARGFDKLNEDETKPFHLYEQKTLPKVGIVGYPYGEDNMLLIGKSINSTTVDRDYFGSTFYPTYSNIKTALVSRRYGLYEERSEGDSHSLHLGAGINDHQSDGAKLFQMFDGNSDNFKGSLLYKTNELFNAGKINSLINRFHTKKLTANDLGVAESAIDSEYGMSRGRNLRKLKVTTHNGYDNPYCRVWTSHHQYSKVGDRIRPFADGDGNFKTIQETQEKFGDGFRPFKGNERLNDMSSLQANGYPLIAPERKATDIKRCMFSIENLAWKDVNFELGVDGASGKVLSKEQQGPSGGRIMWFPPYNLKFQENVGVQWESNNFIGRGEQIHTYVNTERSGTLNFTLLVDHPSIVDSWAVGLNGGSVNTENEQKLLRFFAGCDELEPNMKTTMEPVYKETEVLTEIPEPPVDPEPDPKIGFEKRFYVFFPNNLSGEDYMGEPKVIANYLLNGYSENQGGYEIGSSSQIGKPGPVHGCIDSQSIVGPHRTYEYQVDNKTVGQYLRGDKSNNKDTTAFGLNSNFVDMLTGNTTVGDTTTAEDLKKLREMFNLQDYPVEENIMNFTDFINGELNNIITQDVREDYNISVVVNGFASSHGGYVSTSANDKDKDDNNRLSSKRARYVMSLINSTKLIEKEDISFGENKTLTVKSESVNNLFAKASRSAEAIITFTPKEKAKPTAETVEGSEIINQYENVREVNGKKYSVSKIKEIKGYVETSEYNYDDEYAYFVKIGSSDSLIKKNIVKKVKYFDPAFHSITPEGFNARLTFLHQCTRQGPTYSVGDSKSGSTAGNLAFGRPPVCVLRIGDFYNTKIIIDSISIDYNNGDGIQFDLNPEGIGIQPMMANVTIGFKFLGGSDLSGPISRLQNAVSSNFFANTSVYDRRADYRSTPISTEDKSYNAWNASFNDDDVNNNTKHVNFTG